MQAARTRKVPDRPRFAICAVARRGAMKPPSPIPALMNPTASPRQREKKGPMRMEVGRMETAEAPIPSRKQKA